MHKNGSVINKKNAQAWSVLAALWYGPCKAAGFWHFLTSIWVSNYAFVCIKYMYMACQKYLYSFFENPQQRVVMHAGYKIKIDRSGFSFNQF